MIALGAARTCSASALIETSETANAMPAAMPSRIPAIRGGRREAVCAVTGGGGGGVGGGGGGCWRVRGGWVGRVGARCVVVARPVLGDGGGVRHRDQQQP